MGDAFTGNGARGVEPSPKGDAMLRLLLLLLYLAASYASGPAQPLLKIRQP